MNTATELLEAIRRGELSARELVSSRLDRLRQVDERTHAVIAFNDDRAIEDACRLDEQFAQAGPVGPLHGLPVTVKDWIDVEGFPCAGNSGEFGRRPRADATVVERLRRAGAVVVAKTRPAGSGPAVRHPVDPKRTAGGSSSGEAAVVAAGASPLGIASDSGGSIRLPAAWCGAFGLKPSAGLVPTTGHFPQVGALSDGRTQIGPIARCVDDLELALHVMAGPDGRDAGVVPVPVRASSGEALDGKRFAVLTGETPWTAGPDIVAAVEHFADRLEAVGMRRGEWPMPWLAPAMDLTLRYWSRHELSGEEVERHLEDWDSFRGSYLRAVANIDLVLTPATVSVAPPVRKLAGDDYVFTLPASLTGSPALVLPAGVDADAMPLSVQIIGRPWEDHLVLAAARVNGEAGGVAPS